MIKVEKYSDLEQVKNVAPDVSNAVAENFKNVYDGVEPSEPIEDFVIGEDPGPIVVLDNRADYNNFDKTMVSLGLNKGEYDGFEYCMDVGSGWLNALYMMNNEYGVSIFLKKEWIPNPHNSVIIAEAKVKTQVNIHKMSESVSKKIRNQYFN